MRVVAATENSQLVAALSSTLHAVELLVVNTVRDLMAHDGDDVTFLVERPTSDACLAALADLRHHGSNAPAVLIGDQARVLGEEDAVLLGRPLSVHDVVAALREVYSHRRPGAADEVVNGEDLFDEEGEDEFGGESVDEIVAEAPTEEPSVEQAPPIGEEPTPEDDSLPAPARLVDVTVPTPATVPVPEPPHTPQEGLFRRLLHMWRGNRHDEADDTPRAEAPEQAERLRQAITHAEILQDVLEDYPLLADVQMTAGTVADEIVEATGMDVVAVLLRDGHGHHVVAGHRGLHPGEAELHLGDDHPALRRTREEQGVATFQPTEAYRGLLAGVPGASRQGLVILRLALDGTEHGAVILAYDGPERVGAVRTTQHLLEEAVPALALAGAVWRLPGRQSPARHYLRSWERP